MRAACIILAKSGKSLWDIADRTLLGWVYRASEGYETIISSNKPGYILPYIAYREGMKGIQDPDSFERIEEVVIAAAQHTEAEILHILQPTSPFIAPTTLRRAEAMMEGNGWNSVQAITRVPHQLHAWNQRWLDGTDVHFVDVKKRLDAPTKQAKPAYYQFGGLFSVRRDALLDTGSIWPSRCAGLQVPWWQAVDVDDLEGLDLARLIAKWKGL